MNTTQALAELRKGLRIFEAFAQVEAVASALQGAEQRQAELQASVDSLLAQRAELAAAVERERSVAGAAVAAANDEARGIREAAAAEAADILAKAERHYQDVLRQSDTMRREAEQAAEAANGLHRSAEKAVEAANEELLGLQKRIAAARAEAARILGG